MDFIVNFLLFPVVKEFWKSVEIWRSYRHEFGGTLFGTRCTITLQFILIECVVQFGKSNCTESNTNVHDALPFSKRACWCIHVHVSLQDVSI